MKLPEGHPRLGGHETAGILNAKRPKVRPPREFRDKVIFPGRSLPNYTGPYPVATMEIEIPAKNPQVFSDITRHKRHMLQLETVLMTIYYPANAKGYNLHKHDPHFSRMLWLGRPRWGMAHGFCKFGDVGPLGVPVFLPAWFTKLPAYRNAPIASHWSKPVDSEDLKNKDRVEAGARPEGAPHEPCFPLLMFSHGLGGTRTMYSSQCGEFASYGFVVCAVEHRDGSGPRTYVNYASAGPGSPEDLEKRGDVDIGLEAQRRGYDVIDYLWPKYNRKDTMPNNEQGVDTELRNAQIALRMAELEEAYNVMCEITEGKGQLVADRNLRQKGFKASSSHGLKGVDWHRWKNRVSLDHVTICGHSFGAATTVEILRHQDRFPYISQGIIYDIWGAGTRPLEEDCPDHRIKCPLLAINSEAFTYWPTNHSLTESLIQEAQDHPHPCPSWLLTLRGTVHISQSDFSLLYPNIASFFLKMVANPRRALDLNINASLEFLSHVLPKHLAQVNRAYQNEKLLELECEPLERIPTADQRRPTKENVAMKLKIRHELLYRTSPKMLRRHQRRKNERKGRLPEPGDEVWLHKKPTPEDLGVYFDRLKHLPKQKPGTRPTFLKNTSRGPSSKTCIHCKVEQV